ncbi:MAG TPA: hypothetical protein VGC87_12685 [Pyrinomonadaceae bacterium]|jgi:hypothetical protein
MTKLKFTLNALAVCAFALALTHAAQAAARTYVSPGGSDANNCSTVSTPCLTFQGAHGKTDGGGEIIALASGTYGSVLINRSISIIGAPGVHAEISVTGATNAVTIEAPATTIVVLRNLYLTGTGANKGVNFKTGKTLHVEDCVVNGFDQGIRVVGSVGALTYVKDTTLRNSTKGFIMEPTAADSTKPTQAFIEHSRFESYFMGAIAAGRYTTLIVRDSTFTGRSKDNTITYGGILASPTSIGTTHILVENCLVSNNYLGIGTTTDGVAFISISQNAIYHNDLGVSTCCLSKMITFGNNRFEDNNDDGSPNMSTPLK